MGCCHTELKTMTDENSTTKETINNTEGGGSLDAFFDPGRQLALTIEFYFKYAVLAIGIFGTAANALVLYALVAHHVRDAKKRAINLLIINQNLLDLTCCLLLVISVSIQVNSHHLTGAVGYFICAIFLNNTAVYCALYGSIVNLVALTLERYIKVVHPFWSKKHLKRWMIRAAMAFAWIAGIVAVAPPAFVGTRVDSGVCLAYFESPESKWILGSFNLLFFFFFPLIIFVYCYGRILVVMRRQMRVMAGHNVEGSAQMNASQAQSKRIKWNIIKTMIIVSVAFNVCWLPNNTLFFIHTYFMQAGNLVVGYYPTVFLVYLNICMNPFIYALKHEGAKSQLTRLLVCRRTNDVGDAPENSPSRAVGTHGTRTVVRHR